MTPCAAARPLPVVLDCVPALRPRVQYVFDTLLQAVGIVPVFQTETPGHGPWVSYGVEPQAVMNMQGMLFIAHVPLAWKSLELSALAPSAPCIDGLPVPLPQSIETPPPGRAHICFDLIANTFYFLTSWAERKGDRAAPRQLHCTSEFVRLGIPQDIVDRYLARFVEGLQVVCQQLSLAPWTGLLWPGNRRFALVLSHDVDYLPVRRFDNTVQAAKAIGRHLIRQGDPGDAWRAACGWAAAVANGRDPYGCIPEIIAKEQALGIRSSFQIAVGHRHPADVNYWIEDDHVRDYLRCIVDAGFDLCLHGSRRSTEQLEWYVEEAHLLARRLATPRGSRQHFLSFDYDKLFLAQETAGIRFDMSMGFPDRPGPRAGFSFPYFPYNLSEDRPYRVLQISLFLMDVTLRSYMNMRPDKARGVINATLESLRDRRGCASAVWHPIVFGGARDPGYDRLYFEMAERVAALGGLATDGRTIDAWWRDRARQYTTFASMPVPPCDR